MNWTEEIPEEPGYYFLDDYGDEIIVEVFMTIHGPSYFEHGTTNITQCYSLNFAKWLGPIKSEDIINLWRNFDECNYSQGIIEKTRKYDKS